MRIAAIQCDIVWEDAPANHGRVRPTASPRRPTPGPGSCCCPRCSRRVSRWRRNASPKPRTARPQRSSARQATSHGIWVGRVVRVRIRGVPRADEPLPRRRARWIDRRLRQGAPVLSRWRGGPLRRRRSARDFQVEDLRVTPFVCDDLRTADWFCRAALQTDCYVVVANWPAPLQKWRRAPLQDDLLRHGPSRMRPMSSA